MKRPYSQILEEALKESMKGDDKLLEEYILCLTDEEYEVYLGNDLVFPDREDDEEEFAHEEIEDIDEFAVKADFKPYTAIYG